MTMMTTHPLHCWQSRREFLGYDRGNVADCPHEGQHGNDWEAFVACLSGFPDATCLLDDGHPGEHEWTLDAPAPEAG